jgi:hypothetical protein
MMIGVFILILSDPGVYVKKETPILSVDSAIDTKNGRKSMHITLKKVLKDEAQNFMLYCKKCDTYTSSLGYHCQKCEICVSEFRHHNILLNNCIGKKNLKKYMFYLFFSFILYANLAIWIYLSLEFNTDMILIDMLGFLLTSFLATYFLYNLFIELYFVAINDSYHFPFKNSQETDVSLRAMTRNFIGFMFRQRTGLSRQDSDKLELVNISTQV